MDSKLTRKESYKAQRKSYRKEKKRVASELLNSLQDPAVIVLADWLKVRGTLKSWTKLWCILKPGLMLLYKTPKVKSSHWVGTVLLTSCQVIERPSKKDGFCFKLFHPLDQSIWAPRGPEKESMGAVVQPLPTSYLIFRAPSQAAGKCWMDALELSLRCSALLVRSISTSAADEGPPNESATSGTSSHETQWSEADYEKHFVEHGKLIATTPLRSTEFTCALRNRFSFDFTFETFSFSHHTRHPKAKSDSLSPLPKLFPVFVPNSPCPSPTPLFQQLYLALAHYERMPADMAQLMSKADDGKVTMHRRNSCSSAGTEEGHSPLIRRRQSYPQGKPHIRISNDDKS